MINQKRVKQEVMEAERAFQNCWTRLVILKSQKTERRVLAQAVISFQPELGTALFRLESFFIALCVERRALISKKTVSNRKWSEARVKKIDVYKSVVDLLVDMGKSIGDAFAWLFYQKEHKLLRKHYEHDTPCHSPTGIGGRGEIEFIRNSPMFGDHLVLSHYITSFLRIGDVSLVDLKEFRISAIGELKTYSPASTQLVVTINLIGRKLNNSRLPTRNDRANLDLNPERSHLKPEALVRLRRQIEVIKNAFQPKTSSGELASISHDITFTFSKLEELFLASKSRTWGQVKADRGLMMSGIRFRGTSLEARLRERAATLNNRNLARLAEATKEVIDHSLSDNSIGIGWLHYSPHSRYNLLLGMRPIFWWPISEELCEAIIFRKFAVMTLYNAAFFINDLRCAGLEVLVKPEGELELSRRMEGGHQKILGTGYFLNLIRRYLVPDSEVANILKKFTDTICKAGLKRPARVDLNLDFVFY